MSATEIVSAVLMGGGLVLGVVSAGGVNRCAGVRLRLHSAAKPPGLGRIRVFARAALAAGSWSLAGFLLLVLLAQMLTVPVASVMVGRAAFRRGFVRGGDYAIDELSERLASPSDDDDDEDGFVDDEGDDHEGMHEGTRELFPENVVVDTVTPLTDHNWVEPEDVADDVEDEDVLDIDLEDETELEAGQVAERDERR